MAISSVFKHVFQNNLAHLYSLKSRSAIKEKLTVSIEHRMETQNFVFCSKFQGLKLLTKD